MDDYEYETLLSQSILKKDRHRSAEPYEWYGPAPEPNPPGKNCSCAGCMVRFKEW